MPGRTARRVPTRSERVVHLRSGCVGAGFTAPSTPLRGHALDQVLSRSRRLHAHLTDRRLIFAAAIATSRGTLHRLTPVLSCRHVAASMNRSPLISSRLQVPTSRFSTERRPHAVGGAVAVPRRPFDPNSCARSPRHAICFFVCASRTMTSSVSVIPVPGIQRTDPASVGRRCRVGS